MNKKERKGVALASPRPSAGARTINPADIPENVTPESINPLGNYAVQILWADGFNQVRNKRKETAGSETPSRSGFRVRHQSVQYLSCIILLLPNEGEWL